MSRSFSVLVFLLLSFACWPEQQGLAVVESVVSVHDGDTFSANIAGWPPVAGYRIGVRVAGVDTPEMIGSCPCETAMAKDARTFTLNKLRQASEVRLVNIRRDKYFRILADVWIDGESLAQELIDEGYARPYAGGKKQGWCP